MIVPALVPCQIPLRAQHVRVRYIPRPCIKYSREQRLAQSVVGEDIRDTAHQRVHGGAPFGSGAQNIFEREIQPHRQHLGRFTQCARGGTKVGDSLVKAGKGGPVDQRGDAGAAVGFGARIKQWQGPVLRVPATQNFVGDQAVAGLFGQALHQVSGCQRFCPRSPSGPQVITGGHHVVGEGQCFIRSHRPPRAPDGQNTKHRARRVGDNVRRAGVRGSGNLAAELPRALGTGQVRVKHVPFPLLSKVPRIDIAQHSRIDGQRLRSGRQAAVDVGDDAVREVQAQARFVKADHVAVLCPKKDTAFTGGVVWHLIRSYWRVGRRFAPPSASFMSPSPRRQKHRSRHPLRESSLRSHGQPALAR